MKAVMSNHCPRSPRAHLRQVQLLCQRRPAEHVVHLLCAGGPHSHAQAPAAHGLDDLQKGSVGGTGRKRVVDDEEDGKTRGPNRCRQQGGWMV